MNELLVSGLDLVGVRGMANGRICLKQRTAA
jgi:hypothetical protein